MSARFHARPKIGLRRVVVAGETVGDGLATVAFNGDADAAGSGVGEALVAGVGVAIGAGVAAFLFEFGFDCRGAGKLARASFPFGFFGALLRLTVSGFGLESSGFDRVASRVRLDETPGDPPGTVTTTSSLFARCSTCAVAPGCSRNESTVLSPLRCAVTSANPRPRTASARGTSAAGIFT